MVRNTEHEEITLEPNIVAEAQLSRERPRVERRARVRYSSNQETFCHLIAAEMNDSWWQAEVCNLSADGAGLLAIGAGFAVRDIAEVLPDAQFKSCSMWNKRHGEVAACPGEILLKLRFQ